MDPTERICLHCCLERHRQGGCSECGPDAPGIEVESHPHYLPAGTLLDHGHYLVGRILGAGGFGVTYLAADVRLGMRLAIKELLPGMVATRQSDGVTVVPLSRGDDAVFSVSKQRFLEEAQSLVPFNDHPNIVSVTNFFEENGTAYLVMPYLDGMTLSEMLRLRGDPPDERQTLTIVQAVLDGLRAVHERDLVHRDIKPGNVFITQEGMVKLIDFGAARNAVGERSTSMSAIVTDGYAPFEQYQRRGKRGPYTDIYAVGALIYRMLSGETPPTAPDRILDDELVPLHQVEGIHVSPRLADAVAKAMAVRPEDRYQSVAEFQAVLGSAMAEATQSRPRRLGPYSVVRALGEGATGGVFLVQKAGEGGEGAFRVLKRFHAELCGDPDFVSTVTRCGEIGELIEHRNLVKTHELISLGETIALVMEHVDGVDLAEVISASGRLDREIPLRDALELVAQVADGLQHAHALADARGNPLRLVHRDLKPTNIRITAAGAVKVMDFGMPRGQAQAVDSLGGGFDRSVRYMAPEQARGEMTLDSRTDLYALGSVLYELLTLAPLYPQSGVHECMGAILYGDLEPRLERVPRAVRPLLRQALAREPEARFQSANEFAVAARKLAESCPEGPPVAQQLQRLVRLVSAAEASGDSDQIGPPRVAPVETPVETRTVGSEPPSVPSGTREREPSTGGDVSGGTAFDDSSKSVSVEVEDPFDFEDDEDSRVTEDPDATPEEQDSGQEHPVSTPTSGSVPSEARFGEAREEQEPEAASGPPTPSPARVATPSAAPGEPASERQSRSKASAPAWEMTTGSTPDVAKGKSRLPLVVAGGAAALVLLVLFVGVVVVGLSRLSTGGGEVPGELPQSPPGLDAVADAADPVEDAGEAPTPDQTEEPATPVRENPTPPQPAPVEQEAEEPTPSEPIEATPAEPATPEPPTEEPPTPEEVAEAELPVELTHTAQRRVISGKRMSVAAQTPQHDDCVVSLHWRKSGESWSRVTLSAAGEAHSGGFDVPAEYRSSSIEYYLQASRCGTAQWPSGGGVQTVSVY